MCNTVPPCPCDPSQVRHLQRLFASSPTLRDHGRPRGSSGAGRGPTASGGGPGPKYGGLAPRAGVMRGGTDGEDEGGAGGGVGLGRLEVKSVDGFQVRGGVWRCWWCR